MQCLVGIDDTDSSQGSCTTYVAYRIAVELHPLARVRAYPRLVRLNPNVPFKTRGNAAICLPIETQNPDEAYERITSLVSKLSEVTNGANSGVVFLEDLGLVPSFVEVYQRAISGLVNRHSVERFLHERLVRSFTLGNGMGLVGAAASMAFDENPDHTYELIAYRRRENWGTTRRIDPSSVKEMDSGTFPHTFNNFDYQKRKVLIAPHGPDPVFAGIRGDSPERVIGAFGMLRYGETLEGHMVYVSNQHTDAHLRKQLDWKVFSSGWVQGVVVKTEVGPGGHLYVTVASEDGVPHGCAIYEPTGDLRRAMKGLRAGDVIRAFGGVRRATTSHAKVLNVEKVEVVSTLATGKGRLLVPGIYVSSPRANRHLTKPLIRYGRESTGRFSPERRGWLSAAPGTKRTPRALARSR
jgi:tRNA(Ile2)-agmatinylcytidine synthase